MTEGMSEKMTLPEALRCTALLDLRTVEAVVPADEHEKNAEAWDVIRRAAEAVATLEEMAPELDRILPGNWLGGRYGKWMIVFKGGDAQGAAYGDDLPTAVEAAKKQMEENDAK